MFVKMLKQPFFSDGKKMIATRSVKKKTRIHKINLIKYTVQHNFNVSPLNIQVSLAHIDMKLSLLQKTFPIAIY